MAEHFKSYYRTKLKQMLPDINKDFWKSPHSLGCILNGCYINIWVLFGLLIWSLNEECRVKQ